MKRARKATFGVLAVVLILSVLFTGCASNGEGNSKGSANGSQQKPVISPNGNVDSSDKPVNLNIFIDFTWYDTDKFTGIIPEEITKETGVTLSPTKAADATQLGVLIASDDLPDLVYTDKLLDRLSSKSKCYAYNKLIKDYAPDFRPTEDQVLVAKSLSGSDDYYTILNAASTEEEWHKAPAGCPTLPSLIYRKDILDELNMPMNTLEDYMAVLEAVKARYPDMVPLTMEYTFMTNFFKANMIPNWVATTEGMLVDGDKVVHESSVPQYEEFLKYMNQLYRKGLINAENFAFTDGTQSEELMSNNKAFSMSFMTGDRDTTLTRDLNRNGHKGSFEHAMPMSDLPYTNLGTGWAGVFISRKNTDPKASIKMMEWMFSEKGQRITQWGREGTEYKLDEKGIPQFSDEWLKAREDGTMLEKYNPNYYFGISGVVEAVGRASGISESANAAMDEIRSNLQIEIVLGLIHPKGDSQEKIMGDQVSETVKNYETKVILSNSDKQFDANVKEMHDKLEQIGLKQLEKYYTEEYAKYSK